MTTFGLENAVVEKLIPELQEEGYNVIERPAKRLLPKFLGDYTPDIIALRSDRNLAIEVKSRSDSEPETLGTVSKLFEGQTDWEFRVFLVPSVGNPDALQIQSKQTIVEFIAQCRSLASDGKNAAAFLLSWAIFEAFGRNLLEEKLAKPQTPARVIEFLARDGIVTPQEAKDLRKLAGLRNRLVHGELDAAISSDQIKTMIDMLGTLADISALN